MAPPVAAYGLWARAIEAEDQEPLAELTAACAAALGRIHDRV